MARSKFSRALNMTALRVIAGLATFGFVLWIAVTTFSDFKFDAIEPLPLAISAVIYAAAIMCLPFFWLGLLKAYAPDWALVRHRDTLGLILVYSRSWIARYVPGRVWMFGGRVLYGSAMGIPKMTVLKTTVVEGLMLQVAMLWLVGVVLLASMSQWAGAVGLIVFITALFTLYLRYPQKFINLVPIKRLQDLMTPPSTRAMVSALLYGLVINALLLMSVALIANSLIGGEWALAWRLSALWGVSAVVGYLAIVTPAGLGVREAVGVVLMGTVVDQADAALFMGVTRGAALAVDLILALGAEGYAQGVKGRSLFRRHRVDDTVKIIGSVSK